LFLKARIILKIINKKYKKYIYQYLANIAYKYMKSRTKIAWQNLDFIYGSTKSSQEKENIIKRCYLNHIYVLFFFVEYKNMPFEKFISRINITDSSKLTNAIKENKKIIFANYHYGLWEALIGMKKIIKDKKVMHTVNIFKQPYLQKQVQSVREQYGVKTVSYINSIRPILNYIKQNKMVSIFIDQRTEESNSIKIDFLGKKTNINYSVSMIAKNQNAYIFPLSVNTKDFESFTIDIGDAIIPDDKLDKKEDILRMSILQTKYLEKQINKDPGLWLWIHRRWKYEYPEIYKKSNK
jgi:KDO2-lipid IV(A) lauroyltransferase